MQDTVRAGDRPLNPASTARVAMHPIHPMLVPFPITRFIGALITDIAYWKTAEMMWADFSGVAAIRRTCHGRSGRARGTLSTFSATG